MTDDEDVPPGVEFRDPAQTARWIETADQVRPWRAEVRRQIAERVRGRRRILELGPGPGWLAEAIIAAGEVEHYVVVDCAPPMLALCHARLGDRVSTVLADFTREDWASELTGRFDAVVAMQSVHELRHKRHAERLYRQIRGVLEGELIVADHEPAASSHPRARALFATAPEQHAAMRAAGYVAIETIATFDHGGYYVVGGRASAA